VRGPQARRTVPVKHERRSELARVRNVLARAQAKAEGRGMAAGLRGALASADPARNAGGGRRAGRLAPGCARLRVMAACAACVGLAACGSGRPAGASPTWEVQAGQVRGLGTIVIDGRGFTLHIYQPDRQGPYARDCAPSSGPHWSYRLASAARSQARV